jgi:hypothetical protein
MSAVPRPEALVDAAIRIALGLLAGELLLHASHSGTEALTASGVFLSLRLGCRRLEVHPLLLGRRTALGIQPALGVSCLPCASMQETWPSLTSLNEAFHHSVKLLV